MSEPKPCPGLARADGTREPCGAPRLERKQYCRAHWNEYAKLVMRRCAARGTLCKQRQRHKRLRGPHALELRKGHCRGCGILDASGLCADCAAGAPMVQYAGAMGEERFYQRRPTVFVLDVTGWGGGKAK